MGTFIAELKRRNVFKVGVAYTIVAWLIAQIISPIQTPLRLPDWFETTILVFLAVGFPIALLLAWAYEMTPVKKGNVPFLLLNYFTRLAVSGSVANSPTFRVKLISSLETIVPV